MNQTINPDKQFKEELLAAFHTRPRRSKKLGEYDMSTFSYLCKRELLLDRDSDRYKLNNVIHDFSMNRKRYFEENKFGFDIIQAQLSTYMGKIVEEKFGRNSIVDKSVDFVLELNGISFKGKIPMIIKNPHSGENLVLLVLVINSFSERATDEFDNDFAHLLVLQKAANEIPGYLVYISLDDKKLNFFRQDFDTNALKELGEKYAKLSNLEKNNELPERLRVSEKEHCNYRCKWIDYCWGDDAIPPINMIL